MSRFWAVKKGRKPGIYTSWWAAETQVNKYPGGTHECFKTEAEARVYMGLPVEVPKPVEAPPEKEVKSKTTKEPKPKFELPPPSTDPMVVEIYTDGSHQRKLDYLGIGAWCRYQDAIYELSAKVTRDVLSSYGIARDASCSNPTAEFIAFAEILKRFASSSPDRSSSAPADSAQIEGQVAFPLDSQPRPPFKGKLRFFMDFDGVEKWMLGKQKAKAAHIIKVRDFCIALLKTMSCVVEYVHVPSHSGIEGNEFADKLAYSKLEIDTLKDLIAKLPTSI